MKRDLSMAANLVLVILLLVGITACGGESASNYTSPIAITPVVSGYGGDMGEARATAMMAGPTTTAAMAGEKGVTGIVDPYMNGESRGKTSTGKLAPQINQSPLTAGQVDDNAKFSEYLAYLRDHQWVDALPMSIDQRLFLRVVDSGQKPIAGAQVQLFDGDKQVFEGQTVSDGRVLFFPGEAGAMQSKQFRAVVSRGQQKVEAMLGADVLDQTVSMDLPDNTGAVGLDIVFLMDATGSMDDELAQLRATVAGIASRIEKLPGSSKPRLGLVAYRDRGDEYVTRSWDFTPDVQQFSANLANVQAANGGDTPESVNAGLHDAIHVPGWTDASSGRHLRIIVLVGDAPPHLDYPNDYSYTSLLKEAVAAGIKIFPIGASGLGDTGEYIFRQFAQATQGQFIFLTYANGVSGEPGPSTTNHVSDFTVRNLDGLVVNLVAGEIANQVGEQTQGSNIVPVYVPSKMSMNKPAEGWLSSGLRSIVDQLSNISTVFWVALLGVMLLWSRRATLRARVSASSAGGSLGVPLIEAEGSNLEHLGEEHYSIGRDNWTMYEHEALVKGSEMELVNNSTMRMVAPLSAEEAGYDNGQPTLPLPSLSLAYRKSDTAFAVADMSCSSE